VTGLWDCPGGGNAPALGMGAKYIPNTKDQKAALRFAKKQNPPPNFKKSSDAPAIKAKGQAPKRAE
jgi:hypothetical protein